MERNDRPSRYPRLDLVALLERGELTTDQAERLLENRLEKWRATNDVEFHQSLGLSTDEYTAYMHGATLDDLRRLRYDGWPDTCWRCGLRIDRATGFWWLRRREGRQAIAHVECPEPALAAARAEVRRRSELPAWLSRLSAAMETTVRDDAAVSLDLTARLEDVFYRKVADLRDARAEKFLQRDGVERLLRKFERRAGDRRVVFLHEYARELGAIVVPVSPILRCFDAVWTVAVRDGPFGWVGLFEDTGASGLSLRFDYMPHDGERAAWEIIGWGVLAPDPRTKTDALGDAKSVEPPASNSPGPTVH